MGDFLPWRGRLASEFAKFGAAANKSWARKPLTEKGL
jgi:hypothetical protein